VVSDHPAHTEKWQPLVAPHQGLRLSIPAGFRNWMSISEMRQRVSRLIGESLSQDNLLSTLPPDNAYATNLCKDLALKDTRMNIYLNQHRIKNQKLESILPALKVFIDKFGEKSGNIYDIPESFVKSCGYADHFHWALIAEYYDVNFDIILMIAGNHFRQSHLPSKSSAKHNFESKATYDARY
jgi:hypothetical protein